MLRAQRVMHHALARAAARMHNLGDLAARRDVEFTGQRRVSIAVAGEDISVDALLEGRGYLTKYRRSMRNGCDRQSTIESPFVRPLFADKSRVATRTGRAAAIACRDYVQDCVLRGNDGLGRQDQLIKSP